SASQTSPGPAWVSTRVAATQPTVLANSNRRLAARASARAPSAGMVSMMARYDNDNAAVHASVAQSARWPTTPTKYVLNTVVRMTVVYPELAKSYIAQAQISRRRTQGVRRFVKAGDGLTGGRPGSWAW